MALKFRRGTTAQKSGSLAFGEPFVNTDLNTLQIGGPNGDITLGTTGESSAFAGVSVSASSFISGSALKITGNAAIDGNLTLGGAITIGDATADTVNVVASLSSSLIPSNDNAFDVGRNDKRYRGIYGGMISGSLLEIVSGSNPEIRIKNTSSPVGAYHIVHYDEGSLSIHNTATGRSVLRIDSGSIVSHTHLYGDLFNYSGSVFSTNLYSLGAISGSTITGLGNATTYSSSVNSRLVVVEGVSASAAGALNSVSGAFATTLGNLNTDFATDAELSAVSSAVAVRDAAQDVLISSLQSNIVSASVFTTFSTSVDSRLDSVELISASAASALNGVSGAFSTTISNLGDIYATDGELSSLSGAVAATFSNLDATYVTDTQFNLVSSSMTTRIGNIDSTITDLSTSVDSRLDVVEGVSASSATALNSLSSSAFSAYAKVGAANTFNGNQIISGSLTVTQDLIIGGSASIQHVTSSQLNISDNIITVNTINPSVRFGGLAVIDSGSSPLVSGSFLYDSVHDEFVFVHRGDGTNITSSHFLVGPETYNDLGNEVYLTANKVIKSKGNEHVVESNITDNGSLITLGSNTSVTGTLVATGTSLVSASAQITLSSTTGYSTFSSSIATTNSASKAEYTSFSASAASGLNSLSGAVSTTLLNLGSTYATDAELSAVSSAVATRDAGQDTTISTLSSSVNSRLVVVEGVSASAASALNSVSGAFATTIGNLDNTYATDASVTSVSGAFATTIGNLGSTYATDAELSTVSGAFATSQASQDTLISSLRTNVVSASVFTTFSTSVDSRLDAVEAEAAALESFTSSFNTAFGLSGANVTVKGNLTVQGLTTQIDSTTVNIADNIIQLNGTGATNAGLVVRDATAATTTSGSLLWDTTNDKWIAGPLGSEDDVVLRTLGQTLTNKTISGASNTLSNIANASLTNSSITIAGTSTALGGSITAATILGGTGVISGSAGLPAGIVSGSSQITASVFGTVSGDITITADGVATIAANSVALGTDTTGNYVASLVAGTNITLSNNTGEGATPTIGLTNNAITIAGTSTALGGTITAATILAGTGVVSGSAQIDVSSTTGDIALGTRTSGNYVATITAGTGVSSTGATTGEGIAHTISIGQAVATSDNVRFNSIGVGMAASATAGRIDAANDVVAFSSSDIRFKENIKPIENAIDKIRKISGNTYDWKEENKIEHGYEGNDVGVIAQEIEAVLPQLVQTRESGYKAVKYDKLVALLIEGIKEQQLQIEQLRIDLDNCRNKGL